MLLLAAGAVPPLASGISVTLARTARPGADSTSADAAPPPLTLSAATPCSCIAGAAAVNTPGVPDGPPGASMAAVIGTLDVTLRAPGVADSDGSDTWATEPPGMSRPPPPVGS